MTKWTWRDREGSSWWVEIDYTTNSALLCGEKFQHTEPIEVAVVEQWLADVTLLQLNPVTHEEWVYTLKRE